MAFNNSNYDYDAMRSSDQLSRDLEAVLREFTAKEELYASRRRDLQCRCNEAKSTAAPPSSTNEEQSPETPVQYKVETIREALNLPNLGTDAARTMTVASQLFMEELLQRAAYEAQRDGSATVTPEHLKRVAPYVFLQF